MGFNCRGFARRRAAILVAVAVSAGLLDGCDKPAESLPKTPDSRYMLTEFCAPIVKAVHHANPSGEEIRAIKPDLASLQAYVRTIPANAPSLARFRAAAFELSASLTKGSIETDKQREHYNRWAAPGALDKRGERQNVFMEQIEKEWRARMLALRPAGLAAAKALGEAEGELWNAADPAYLELAPGLKTLFVERARRARESAAQPDSRASKLKDD